MRLIPMWQIDNCIRYLKRTKGKSPSVDELKKLAERYDFRVVSKPEYAPFNELFDLLFVAKYD